MNSRYLRGCIRGVQIEGECCECDLYISYVSGILGVNWPFFAPTKLSYAGSYLRGAAFEWLTPQVHHNGQVNFTSYSEFIQALHDAFGNPDEVATAEQEI